VKCHLPEDHECKNFQKGNIFLRNEKIVQHSDTKNESALLTGYQFNTLVFNLAFNTFIAKNQVKIIGKVHSGGTHDSPILVRTPASDAASKLEQLRNQLVLKPSITEDDIKTTIRICHDAYKTSKYDPELELCIREFIKNIKQEFGYDLRPVWRQINAEEPIQKPDKDPPKKTEPVEKPEIQKPIPEPEIPLGEMTCARCSRTGDNFEQCNGCKTTYCYHHIHNHDCKANVKKDTLWRWVRKWGIWLLLLSLILLVILTFILVKIPQEEPLYEEYNETQFTTQQTTTTAEKPVKLSFTQYLNNPPAYANKKASLIGRLTFDVYSTTGNTGFFTEFIVDDYEQRIPLINVQYDDQSLFPKKTVTTNVYMINGTFRNLPDGFKFDVESITLTQRKNETITIQKDVQDQIVVTKRRPITQTNQETGGLLKIKLFIMGECIDGSKRGECTQKQPEYCNFFTTLTENPSKCGCPENTMISQGTCVPIVKCSDGTLDKKCSTNKPYYCDNGTLTLRARVCNCPENYRLKGDNCEEILRCSDGTIYGECSSEKPFQCINGYLQEKASICGCPTDSSREYIADGDQCVLKYQNGPKEITLSYVRNGIRKKIHFTAYKGLNDHLAGLSRSISYTTIPPTKRDFIMKNIDNSVQKEFIRPLIEEIQGITPDRDEQARIAINLVQQIPYDMDGLNNGDLNGRYAYEVLYDEKGVCGEKSELLALILRELGFGVAIFEYELEQHESLGIKCPSGYDYLQSGYCFVETTQPNIITYLPKTYLGVGELKSKPQVITISQGSALEDVTEEYTDANYFEQLEDMGPVLDQYYYNMWWRIIGKYGLKTG